MKNYNVAIVGATGAVGKEMLRVLQEQKFPIKTLKLLASERSAGLEIPVDDVPHKVECLTPASFRDIEFALFSAGGTVSYKFAPIAAAHGAVAIDNTNAFRMDDTVPLVVPEVNPEDIASHPGIIANPNCSTIQMVLALAPLHKAAGLKRVIVSTYQAASGAGARAMSELLEGSREVLSGQKHTPNVFTHSLPFNCIPHIGSFSDDGFTTEEIKMVKETQKIMHLPELEVAATCVRVPVFRGHSESVSVLLEKPLTTEVAKKILNSTPGVSVVDNPEDDQYPMPIFSTGQDTTFIGRIRQDRFDPRWLHFWVVSDNLRKGAATNAVQIALKLISDKEQ